MTKNMLPVLSCLVMTVWMSTGMAESTGNLVNSVRDQPASQRSPEDPQSSGQQTEDSGALNPRSRTGAAIYNRQGGVSEPDVVDNSDQKQSLRPNAVSRPVVVGSDAKSDGDSSSVTPMRPRTPSAGNESIRNRQMNGQIPVQQAPAKRVGPGFLTKETANQAFPIDLDKKISDCMNRYYATKDLSYDCAQMLENALTLPEIGFVARLYELRKRMDSVKAATQKLNDEYALQVVKIKQLNDVFLSHQHKYEFPNTGAGIMGNVWDILKEDPVIVAQYGVPIFFSNLGKTWGNVEKVEKGNE